MSAPLRQRSDTEILMHLCRAMALKSLLTGEDPHDDPDAEPSRT